MTTQLLLGVDVGTSDSKVLVTTRSGAEVCLVTGPTTWTQPAGGLAETSATTLADGLTGLMERAVGQAREQLGAATVAGIAVTGMAEIGVLVDGTGRPVHPAIAWFDPRGGPEIAAAPTDFREQFPARTGLPASGLASIAKLMWLRGQGVRAAGLRWLNLPEFVVCRLGGQPASELSLASRTGLIDQAGPRPWAAALDLIDADESLLAPIVGAGTPLGRVRADRAPDALVGAVLTVAGHDHLVAAVGCGVTGTDELFDSFGTADALIRSIAAVPPAAVRAALAAAGINALPHALPDRAVLLGGTKAGLILRRTLDLLGATDDRRREELDHAAMSLAGRRRAGASDLSAGAGGVGWDGAVAESGGLTATGTANGDGVLRIVVDGDGCGPAALWQAVLDNASVEADRLLAIMADVAGPVRRTVVAGGWIRMSSVRAAKSRAIPGAEFSDRRQAGAFGAAVFAAHAATVADSMAANGDAAGIGIADPSGPTGEFVAAFVGGTPRSADRDGRIGGGMAHGRMSTDTEKREITA